MTEQKGIRINQFLAKAGLCSRRGADQLVEKGRVQINGRIAVSGERVQQGDRVLLDGKPVSLSEAPEPIYIALNKPRGIVCTTDRKEPANIVDFLGFKERIFPIGRLDKDSDGLILLTNDGAIVNRILRAQYGHEKEYQVEVDRPLTAAFLEGMGAGVPILGTVTNPSKIRRTGPQSFRIVLTQGLNRQIRRMCKHFGYEVTSLRRVRIMHITLGSLKKGEWRELTYKELRDLEELLEQSERDLPPFKRKK